MSSSIARASCGAPSDLVFANTIDSSARPTLVDADDATAYADRGAAITALIERVHGWL